MIPAIHIMNLRTLDLNLLLVFEAMMDERNSPRICFIEVWTYLSILHSPSIPNLHSSFATARNLFPDLL